MNIILLGTMIPSLAAFLFGFLHAAFTTSTNEHLIMTARDRRLCVGAVMFMAVVVIILGAIEIASL